MDTLRRFLSITIFLCLMTMITTFIAQAQTPLYYVPTGPCRLADTRDSHQPPGFGTDATLIGGVARAFIPSNNPNCHIPNDAAAYALNLTVVPPGYLDYVTVWPDDEATQPGVSTLNSWDGRIKANSLIVGGGAKDGGFYVFATDNTDVVLDVTGYWVTPEFFSNDVGLMYSLLPGVVPCNVYNSLNGNQGGMPILANTVTNINVATGNPFCNIPGNAKAYALNFTAIPAGGAPAPISYFQAWPGDQPVPPHTSVLNAPTGTTVANMSIVETSDGTINVYSTADTNLSIDVYGYFADANTSPNELALYPVVPARCWDTRPNPIDLGPYGVDIHTTNSPCYSSFEPDFLPNAEAYVLNATVIPLTSGGIPEALGALYVWTSGMALPELAVLEALDGAVTSNMTITPSLFALNSPGAVSTDASNPTNMVLDVSAVFQTDQLSVASSHLPDAQDNVTYYAPASTGFQMIGWGGVGPGPGGVPGYTWTGGGFPAALGISASGLVSGCPTASPGTYQPVAQVTDPAGNVSTLTVLSINVIGPPPPPLISTVLLPPAPVNQPYSFQLAVGGGLAPFTWTYSPTGPPTCVGNVCTGLPDNMTMSSTGLITGAPPLADNGNTYTFAVTVTDSECLSGLTDTVLLSITVPLTM